MRSTRCNEWGQASVLEAAIALLAVLMLALPLYEYGRMANDSILAASAAEDAAKAIAANPSLTHRDISTIVTNAYPTIADSSSVSVSVSPTRQEHYNHYLNLEEGGHVARPSTVSWREVEVSITVKRSFLFQALPFIGTTAGSTGYEITKTASAASDASVKSGEW